MAVDQPLHGVTILSPDLAVRSFGEYDEDFRYITDRAAHLGATIVSDASGDPELHSQNLRHPNAYAVIGSSSLIRQVTAKIEKQPFVTQPVTKEYLYCTPAHLALPFVLVTPGDTAQKYLIENEQQVTRIQKLVHDNPLTLGLTNGFKVQEWIPTPNPERYSAYNIITAPTGDVLAAGLWYSNYSKKDAPQIPEPHLNANSSQPLTAAFESPKNTYFLGAKEFRTGATYGGTCIPLVGDNTRRLSRLEKRILQTHDINPKDRALPGNVHHQSILIAKSIGKVTGLACELTFIEHQETSEAYFLGAKAFPRPAIWSECWPNDDTKSERIARKQLLDSSLDAIINAQRNRSGDSDIYRFLVTSKNGNIAYISIDYR